MMRSSWIIIASSIAVATFGRLIGRGECPLPTHGFDWIGTNQPIALRHWPAVAATRIGIHDDREMGAHIGPESGIQRKEFSEQQGGGVDEDDRFAASHFVENDAGDAGDAGGNVADFRGAWVESGGCGEIDAELRSVRGFHRGSAGEFTVAKEIYAGLPSGWFSDRSSAYLASGRPVVTQASGFDQWLPTGEGLFRIGRC